MRTRRPAGSTGRNEREAMIGHNERCDWVGGGEKGAAKAKTLTGCELTNAIWVGFLERHRRA